MSGVWKRWATRLQDLGGKLSDPAMCVKALSTVVQTPQQALRDLNFRVGLFRAQVMLDTIPTEARWSSTIRLC